MAVAFDAAVENERTGTTDPWTWTHSPSGTPRGVTVLIVHGTESTDLVVGVTYGGVAMTRIVTAADTATEAGRVYLYFLGASIPTGNQTVSVDLTAASGTDMHGVSVSVMGGADTEVVDSDSVSENAANPSVTLQYGGRTCLALAALYGGGASPASFTENGNCTRIHDFDIAAFYSVVLRQTTPGSTDFAIGGTAGSDDVAYAALAISEVFVERRGIITWAEFEVPTAPRRAIVTWAEFEVPTAPRRAIITWAEFEVPAVSVERRGIVTWAELEVPDGPRRAILSWAEFEVPNAPRRAIVTWAEFEVPDIAAGGGRTVIRSSIHVGILLGR